MVLTLCREKSVTEDIPVCGIVRVDEYHDRTSTYDDEYEEFWLILKIPGAGNLCSLLV